MPRKSKAEKRQADIERVAWELCQNRLLLGKSGDKHSDLEKAEKIVCSPIRTTLFAINRPLIRLEKNLIEPINQHLRDSATFDIIDRISPALEAIGILLIPLVLYLATQAYEQQRAAQENERLQQETVQNYIGQLSEIFLNVDADLRDKENQKIRTIATAATITLFRDPNLDSARKGQIIEFLSQMDLIQELESDIDGEDPTAIISLSRVDLSNANLREANLYNADLREANLTDANLTDANLREANLYNADLSGADLSEASLYKANLTLADLNKAHLSKAGLSEAGLSGADLRGADLSGTNLEEADLTWADLRGANLRGANLKGADFFGADLRGADLYTANLYKANLYHADLRRAKLTYAWLCFTKLPDDKDITLDPNRGCEVLDIDPKTGKRIGGTGLLRGDESP